MTKIAWFIVVLFIITKMAGIKSTLLKRNENDQTLSLIITELSIICFLITCVVIVTIDVLRWLYPILH